jgi:hypothetical protein
MMRNKRTLLFLVMLLLGTYSWAQSSVFDHPLSGQTLVRFDAICAQLASRPYTKGVFVQTRTLRRQNRSLLSSGDFIIAADLGVVWLTKSPVPSITALGRDYMIQSVPGGTGTRIDAAGNDIFISMADTISSLFTGNAQRLKSGFDNYCMEAQTVSGTFWTVGLVPKDRTFRNYAQRIVIAGFYVERGAVIQTITIHERSGDSLAYAFSEQSFPVSLETNEQAYFRAN